MEEKIEDFGDDEYILYRLERELDVQFIDRKKLLLKTMYTYISHRKAFEAGNDIVVFRFNKDEEQRVLNNIVQLVESGKIKENRIDRSVNRIIEIKEKYDISDKQNFEGVNVDKINEKIIDIRKKCNIENT